MKVKEFSKIFEDPQIELSQSHFEFQQQKGLPALEPVEAIHSLNLNVFGRSSKNH